MVSLVTKPADNGNSIIQMIPKTTNIIVNDNSLGLHIRKSKRGHKIAVQRVQIFDIVSVDVQAVLAIQTVADEMLFRVENVQQSIRIALLRRRVDHNFVVRSHAFQQIEQKRTHIRIDRKTLPFVPNLPFSRALLPHRESQIRRGIALHGAVNQRFVQIQNERVFGSVRRLGRKEDSLLHREGEAMIGREVFDNDHTTVQPGLRGNGLKVASGSDSCCVSEAEVIKLGGTGSISSLCCALTKSEDCLSSFAASIIGVSVNSPEL